MSLPPSLGFDALASTLYMVRDEVFALRIKVTGFRQSNEKDQKAFVNVNCVLQDAAQIKTLIHTWSTYSFQRRMFCHQSCWFVSERDDFASEIGPVDVSSFISADDSSSADTDKVNGSAIASASNSNIKKSLPTANTYSVTVGNSNSAKNANVIVSDASKCVNFSHTKWPQSTHQRDRMQYFLHLRPTQIAVHF